MTNLQKTNLPTSRKTELAVLAMALQGQYGAIMQLSESFKVSRPTVYAVQDSAAAVLDRHFDSENQTQERLVLVDEAHIRRTVVALRIIAPNALRPIEDLISILYPGHSISYGKIQGIVAEAEQRARMFNQEADMSAIVAGAVDEMFSQGAPVLAGVDLDSGYLFALALRESRSGEDWAEVLEVCKKQGMELKTVVKDAALGIEAGVKAVYPDAEQRDDCFHAHYAMGKVYFRLERKAYGAIAKVEEIKVDIEKCRRTGRGDRAKLHGQLIAAKRRCNVRIDLHDRFEVAMRRIQEAMEVVEPSSGRLRQAEWMQTEIEQAAAQMLALDDDKCRKVGRYLSNRAPGLASHACELASRLELLCSLWGQRSVELACQLHRLLSDLSHGGRSYRKWEARKQLRSAYAQLRQMAGEQADRVLAGVDLVMRFRHRASSAIEGFNAALRPHLYVHKGVSQGFLELFRAHHNLHTRRWGRHKGTSAHALVTGEKVDDWLTLLGYPPSSAVN